MPTTAADIVTRAFRRLGIKAEDESLSADQAAHGLDVLNSMLSAWRLDGINYTHATMLPTDQFTLGDEFVEATVTLLAGALAPDYSVAAPADTEIQRRKLQSALMGQIPTLRAPAEMLRRSPADGWRR